MQKLVAERGQVKKFLAGKKNKINFFKRDFDRYGFRLSDTTKDSYRKFAEKFSKTEDNLVNQWEKIFGKFTETNPILFAKKVGNLRDLLRQVKKKFFFKIPTNFFFYHREFRRKFVEKSGFVSAAQMKNRCIQLEIIINPY